METIISPADHSPYLCDAAIDTDAFLATTLGPELDLDIPLDWDNDPEIPAAAGCPGYVELHRDNVYNNEQDFSAIFTFTVFGPEDSADWIWSDEDLIVAVCLHRGGDARGNYGGPQIYRASNLAECGFLEWKLGFAVYSPDGENLDEDGRFSAGYSACPSSELENALDSDSGSWLDGEYHATIDGEPVVITPSLYLEGQ
jgi:hypothetical protein